MTDPNTKPSDAPTTGVAAEDPTRKANADVGPSAAPAAPTTTIMEAEDVIDSAPLSLVTVLIQRDSSTQIPAVVRGYEVPVMLSVYGEDAVFVIGEEEDDVSDFDVQRAYEALQTKYRRQENAVKLNYRSLGDFARQIGVKPPAGTAPSSRDKQSLQKVRKPAPKKAAATKR